MSYDATVYNVMIASPGDVEPARRLIREVVHEWNMIHAEDRRVILLPVGWETHSAPTTGDRAQAIINRQVLERADLLIAVFWTRLGSPTGTSPSGTGEEIERHIASGKACMIYFSSEPVRPDSIDADQYSSLTTWREQLKKKGLIETYETLTDFRLKLTRQLAQTVIGKFARRKVDHQTVSVEPRGKTDTPSLSPKAVELLLEALQDKNGTVLVINSGDGGIVQTNERNLVETGDPRSEAYWEAALEELRSSSLIQDPTGVGEIFQVTSEGYRVGDHLRVHD